MQCGVYIDVQYDGYNAVRFVQRAKCLPKTGQRPALRASAEITRAEVLDKMRRTQLRQVVFKTIHSSFAEISTYVIVAAAQRKYTPLNIYINYRAISAMRTCAGDNNNVKHIGGTRKKKQQPPSELGYSIHA